MIKKKQKIYFTTKTKVEVTLQKQSFVLGGVGTFVSEPVWPAFLRFDTSVV